MDEVRHRQKTGEACYRLSSSSPVLSLMGLGVSGMLVSRAQQAKAKRDARMAAVSSPHTKVPRVEISAFHAPRHGAQPVAAGHGRLGCSASTSTSRNSIRCAGTSSC